MSGPKFLNLSPGLDRVGRACAWIEHEGLVLMTGLEWGGWTLPGGGIHPGETPEQAAVREAWEEAGAHCEVAGEAVILHGDSACVPLRLLSQEPSPEGRPAAWVNPRALPWADDIQIRQVLAARGRIPAHLDVPSLVWLAQSDAARLGFDRSCSLETGRLLRTLAAMRPGGRLLELGSGAGVGAAWLLSGMDAAARLLTVEADPLWAETVWALLATDPRAEVLHGDWTGSLDRAPFDLIFADCAAAKVDVERLADALRVGGTLVMDNFSPPAFIPEALYAGDPLRDLLFTHPRLTCVEVEVSRRERVIVATRTT
ncbi:MULTISPECIES: NUDIX domain-containing protein [Deinococcus]|uniref:NUDIX domain-containing protein n=1 Tax=Deinococcus rufus TaxID=2136097 RepID=A0ABV7Z2W1_9DEIO|nr:NUDIX domain-containing protein [Deinococcus sp. AB2017081]WQE95951.1 NUDIX domain-containing protein [Deinococcus sp. AB2017081]